MGRPKKEIDAAQVMRLAKIGCTASEIAAVVGSSDDTIRRRFAAEMEKGRESLKMSLRRMQLAAAKKGNVVMMIWLGKQYLGQAEKIEQQHKGLDFSAMMLRARNRKAKRDNGDSEAA